MEKKTIIIISIVSSIISLIYILLNYFGIIRYIGLYMFSIEGYTKKYKDLDKIGTNKIVIAMSPTKKQTKTMIPTIKSLLDQTVKVDLISCIIPYDKSYDLPIILNDSVSVYRCNEDKGYINSLLSTLTREGELTTTIIILGADKIYGKDFIETLLDMSEQKPDNIIYANNKDYIDLSCGVLFKTSFFDEKALDLTSNKELNMYFASFPKERVSYNENYKTF